MQRGAQGFLDRLVIQSLALVNGQLRLTGRIIQERRQGPVFAAIIPTNIRPNVEQPSNHAMFLTNHIGTIA
jgi:hypothetical protein